MGIGRRRQRVWRRAARDLVRSRSELGRALREVGGREEDRKVQTSARDDEAEQDHHENPGTRERVDPVDQWSSGLYVARWAEPVNDVKSLQHEAQDSKNREKDHELAWLGEKSMAC